MKLLCLNTACGQVFKPLIKFLEKYSNKDVDIFCFQEILFGSEPDFTPIQKARINLYSEIKKILPDYNPKIYYSQKDAKYFYYEQLPQNTRPGLAIFIKKEQEIDADGGFRLYKKRNLPGVNFGALLTGNCQWIDIQGYTILNLHGLYQRNSHKKDTPERVTQVKIIQKFLRTKKTKKILCGDFNLLPENPSMKIIEKDMVNLIKEYKIKSTRSSLYKKPQRHANYVLISKDVNVKEFRVLNDTVSDHSPLYLDFD